MGGRRLLFAVMLIGCCATGCARASSAASGGWCYARLTSDEQAAYVAVQAAIDDPREETVVVGGQTTTGVVVQLPVPLSEESAARVYESVLADCPQAVYVRRACTYEWKNGNCTALTIAFSAFADERQAMTAALAAAARETLADMPRNADAFTRMLYCHDALAKRCRYKEEAVGDPDRYPSAFTAYGALVEKEAVCEGYARAFVLLLSQAGIAGTTVTGTANGAAHMWNVAEPDGIGVEIDVTWDDSPEGLRHTYCGLTSAEMAHSRTAATSAVGTVTVTGTAANYHRRTGRYLETASKRALEYALEGQGTEPLSLRFSEECYPLQKGRLLVGRSAGEYTCVFDDDLCTVTLFPVP